LEKGQKTQKIFLLKKKKQTLKFFFFNKIKKTRKKEKKLQEKRGKLKQTSYSRIFKKKTKKGKNSLLFKKTLFIYLKKSFLLNFVLIFFSFFFLLLLYVYVFVSKTRTKQERQRKGQRHTEHDMHN
jgi:hypothetical protein